MMYICDDVTRSKLNGSIEQRAPQDLDPFKQPFIPSLTDINHGVVVTESHS